VALPEGILFVELARVQDGWLWCSDMISNKLDLGLGYFRRLAVERANGKMESVGGGGGSLHGMVDFSRYRLLICCEGCLESCSIFILDLRNMGQSFVRWLVSLPWYIQYGGQNVYGSWS
jgi:hypothetical protein